MSFDKSLKLINYAKNDNGFLKLFTELDHEYSIGDKIFVVGGYLDKSAELLHISDYSSGTPTQYNPFNSDRNGYKILATDIVNNSFTINYIVTDATVVYPYGITLNRFGDPQDAVNIAYNSFTGNDMYKNIYVSRTCFIAGALKKGEINNGIFGNDDNTVILNNPSTTGTAATQANIVINHIASKNIAISKGIIKSKTDIVNPITKKLYVVEDLSIDIDNPFSTYTSGITNNNNGFGYSSFESFIHSNEVIINNGDFNNPYDNKIQFNSLATITRAKIGAAEPMYLNGCAIDDITISAGILNNTTYTSGIITANNTLLDNFIPINATAFTWDATHGEVTFNVEYNSVANRIWPTLPADIFISSIESSDGGFHIMNEGLIGTLENVTYTFGDITSAYMTFSFPALVTDWSTIILEAENTFTVTDTKIALRKGYDQLATSDGDVLGYFGNTLGTVYFGNNNIVGAGYYTNVIHDNTTDFYGSSLSKNIYMTGCYQIQSNLALLPNMINIISNTTQALRGNFNHSKIVKGIVFDSKLYDTRCIPTPTEIIYLDNCSLYTNTKVEEEVLWNDIDIQFYGDVVSGTTITHTSYLGDRVTPWKTNISGVAPLVLGEKSLRLNKRTGSRANDIAYYTSQHKIDATPFSVAPAYATTFVVPVIENVQTVYDATKLFVIIDHGEMQPTWTMIAPTGLKIPLYADMLSNNALLQNGVNARRLDYLGGTVNTFAGVALPPASTADIVEVDDEWVYTLANTTLPTDVSAPRDISIDVHDTIDTVAEFPDPLLNDILSQSTLKLYPDAGPDIDGIVHDIVTSTSIPNATHEFAFRHTGIFTNNGGGKATIVPVGFIETEQIIMYTKDLSDVVQSIDIVNCNFCPEHGAYVGGDQYSWDNNVDPSLYPTDFILNDSNNLAVTFEMTPITKVEVHIVFWITWYYEESTMSAVTENNPNIFSNYSGGYRTKHTFKHTFSSNNETFFILDDAGDAIIDDAGDTIVWI